MKYKEIKLTMLVIWISILINKKLNSNIFIKNYLFIISKKKFFSSSFILFFSTFFAITIFRNISNFAFKAFCQRFAHKAAN